MYASKVFGSYLVIGTLEKLRHLGSFAPSSECGQGDGRILEMTKRGGSSVHVRTRDLTRQHRHRIKRPDPYSDSIQLAHNMSRASIEQALTGLIPTLSGPLPAELIELALSLLTRSRSVATSMKPDEEIARPYACAQLACERYEEHPTHVLASR